MNSDENHDHTLEDDEEIHTDLLKSAHASLKTLLTRRLSNVHLVLVSDDKHRPCGEYSLDKDLGDIFTTALFSMDTMVPPDLANANLKLFYMRPVYTDHTQICGPLSLYSITGPPSPVYIPVTFAYAHYADRLIFRTLNRWDRMSLKTRYYYIDTWTKEFNKLGIFRVYRDIVKFTSDQLVVLLLVTQGLNMEDLPKKKLASPIDCKKLFKSKLKDALAVYVANDEALKQLIEEVFHEIRSSDTAVNYAIADFLLAFNAALCCCMPEYVCEHVLEKVPLNIHWPDQEIYSAFQTDPSNKVTEENRRYLPCNHKPLTSFCVTMIFDALMANCLTDEDTINMRNYFAARIGPVSLSMNHVALLLLGPRDEKLYKAPERIKNIYRMLAHFDRGDARNRSDLHASFARNVTAVIHEDYEETAKITDIVELFHWLIWECLFAEFVDCFEVRKYNKTSNVYPTDYFPNTQFREDDYSFVLARTRMVILEKTINTIELHERLFSLNLMQALLEDDAEAEIKKNKKKNKKQQKRQAQPVKDVPNNDCDAVKKMKPLKKCAKNAPMEKVIDDPNDDCLVVKRMKKIKRSRKILPELNLVDTLMSKPLSRMWMGPDLSLLRGIVGTSVLFELT